MPAPFEKDALPQQPGCNIPPLTPEGAVIIGGGPAGLMAAQALLEAGIKVDLFEAMPTVARKFLYAGKSGMNITHAEDTAVFLTRYNPVSGQPAHPSLIQAVKAFDNHKVKNWVETQGIETFIGSSGRVFPTGMKAAPLLRSWLQRLKSMGLTLHTRYYWQGWQQDQLCFSTPDGERYVKARATLLALGGGSWKKLGSDGLWLQFLKEKQIDLSPLKPANCGFKISWPAEFATSFAGTPVKTITLSVCCLSGQPVKKSGDMMISQKGIEGGLVYSLSAALREQIIEQGKGSLHIDLLPARP